MKSSKQLRIGREVITKPENWTKGVSGPGHCMLSALPDWVPLTSMPYTYLRMVIPGEHVSKFNDRKSTTHDDVLLAYDAAIGIAEAEGD